MHYIAFTTIFIKYYLIGFLIIRQAGQFSRISAVKKVDCARLLRIKDCIRAAEQFRSGGGLE